MFKKVILSLFLVVLTTIHTVFLNAQELNWTQAHNDGFGDQTCMEENLNAITYLDRNSKNLSDNYIEKNFTEMEKFNGYLFAKLQAIGSKSEGPVYYLQQFDLKEIKIKKDANLWEADPNLHKYLNKKVTIEGVLMDNEIEYDVVRLYKHHTETNEGKELKLELELSSDTVFVNKDMPSAQSSQFLEMSLLVEWPYRSIWEGECPTTQLYDFTIECEDYPIWRWSDDKMFEEVITPVSIKGGKVYKFNEVWKINPLVVKADNKYTVRAKFIASEQEVTKNFEVKFSQSTGILGEASTYNLRSDDVSIKLYLDNQGSQVMEYKDQNMERIFTGESIVQISLYQGNLISVILEQEYDGKCKSLSLIVPAANLKNADSVKIETYAIYTTIRSSIGGPILVEGQIQSYEIVSLTGNAW